MVAIIDVEASGLGPESYPIEIAAYNGSDVSYSVLINPETVDDWIHWDELAEENYHRISRDYLSEHGKDAFLTVIEMNKVLDGQVLYSDAVDSDRFWVDRLYNEILGRKRTFEIRSLFDLFKPGKAEYVRETMSLFQGELSHRAMDDCISIYDALLHIPDELWIEGENLIDKQTGF